MKWYPAMFPAAKDQIKTLDKMGVKNRLVSFHFIDKEIKDNRRKIMNKKIREMDPEARKEAMEKALDEEVLKEKSE